MRDTRSELLMQAEVLVRGRGYSGFSYADLADAVGIRKASIHHHFRTKEDLAIALVAAYDTRYDEALASILVETDEGVARIEAYGRLYLAGVEKGLGCLCAALAVELDTLPEALRTDVARFFDKHIAWLERVLSEGKASGSIRMSVDPAASARMVVAALEGALLLERLLAGAAGFESTLTALGDCLRPTAS
ncbi:TetR/AcrR family transcriptional regulator [Methylobacterium gnaphalii]|uniref:TetR family transcriptional regulator n=1 Tax=Methylobacterium gnaphalii TaxID=1010610 RepID=A0A512JFQ0_9HYPH|nr:TetR/AcrR family transcriptional regulator [Methylobacterium gnaphalii]GEP08752.1 TetR family transcriptional regulator [Methylobacterium gnaphalii]GJD69342.1 HTH-type transcriptional repressor NemR [Methylobacterium gnaphalii]GLS47518.1 TetR family transcriptional regulator [Methylobacterium gnaphalii]